MRGMSSPKLPAWGKNFGFSAFSRAPRAESGVRRLRSPTQPSGVYHLLKSASASTFRLDFRALSVDPQAVGCRRSRQAAWRGSERLREEARPDPDGSPTAERTRDWDDIAFPFMLRASNKMRFRVALRAPRRGPHGSFSCRKRAGTVCTKRGRGDTAESIVEAERQSRRRLAAATRRAGPPCGSHRNHRSGSRQGGPARPKVHFVRRSKNRNERESRGQEA
jgi:hypothetical protein